MSGNLVSAWPEGLSPDDFVPIVNRLVERVSRRFPAPIGQRLAEEAVSRIYQRLGQFCASRGCFARWCYRLLYNRALDLLRWHRRSRTRLLSLEALSHLPDPIAVQSPEAEQRTEAILADLRSVRRLLDDISWGTPSQGEVDYFAVLLLHLRLAMAGRLGQTLTGDELQPAGGVAGFLAHVLPWSRAEEGLRCRRGLPPLADVWEALRPEVDRLPCRVSGEDLCRTLSRLQPGGPALNPLTWHQWCQRARKAALRRMGPEAWDRYFAPWLLGKSAPEEGLC